MKLSPRRLVTRVALSCALSIIAASASVALVSLLISDRITRTREDATLTDAAETLALELRRPGADPHWIAVDEARELAHTNIRSAVFAGERWLAGDKALGLVRDERCVDRGDLRSCARRADPWLAVVARDQRPLREQRQLLRYAAALAVLFTSTLGGLAALSIARVVVRPLEELRHRVEQVPDSDPSAAVLGADVGLLEVDALRTTLRTVFERLGAALAQSRRFASDAAHELRTPLATLMGELELAAERARAEERTGIAHALRVAQRMSTLLDRLLILAQLEALQDAEHIDTRELIEDAVETLAPLARARVVLELDAERDALPIHGDRALLTATLTNALENALKFSAGPVRVQQLCSERRVTLAIVDLGPGIEHSQRERVFAPFYRTPASRAGDVAGHGIGLALIAHVMTLHHGTARFADCERGARLELSLPLANESEALMDPLSKRP